MKNAALSRALKWLFIAQMLSIVALLPLVYVLKSLLGAASTLLTLAARGTWVWRVNLICTVAGIVLTAATAAAAPVLSKGEPEMTSLWGLFLTINLSSIVLTLVGRLFYTVFLYQSTRCV